MDRQPDRPSGGARQAVPAFRSPSIAATLSFLVPGLGQAALGSRRRAVLVALPAVGLVVAAAVVVLGGTESPLDLVMDPAVFATILILNVGLAAYHLLAIVDAYRVGRRLRIGAPASRLGLAWVAVLLAATLGMHGGIEALGLQTNGALCDIFECSAASDDDTAGLIPEASFGPEPSDPSDSTFEPDPSGDPGAWVPGESGEPDPSMEPDPSGGPGASWGPDASDEPDASFAPDPTAPATGPGDAGTPRQIPWMESASPTRTPSPSPTRTPTPRPTQVPKWARDGRLNLLLIGADAGPDRWSLRTDTMIVLSVSVRTARTAMFGIPRNLVNVPLAPESAGAFRDGRFPYLLNALYVYAMGHPDRFPGGANRGFRAVAGAVQELVGVPLDGMAVVNLAGFVQLVNQLGGLWIDIPEPLHDANYPLEDGTGWMTLDLHAGCQHLDGRTALAYARSRHQDSDYGRMGRQQEVLVALRNQLDPLRVASKASSLLSIARNNVWTTIARRDVVGLARLASRIDSRRIRTILFAPSQYPEHLDTRAITQIRSVVRHALDHPMPLRPEQPNGARCR